LINKHLLIITALCLCFVLPSCVIRKSKNTVGLLSVEKTDSVFVDVAAKKNDTILQNSGFLQNDSNFLQNNITSTDNVKLNDTVVLKKDNVVLKTDTVSLPPDSTATATVTDSLPPKKQSKNALEYPVDFSATDSIVLFGDGRVHLYKEGKLVYHENQIKEITADFIRVKMDSSTMHAIGVKDTLGNLSGSPVFKDGGQEYSAKEINYNFKTQKGYIRGAVAQEGEGYIIADITKKTADGYLNMKGGKYTTCDNHDHPHFYMQLTKGRVKPGGFVAAGPAYLVVEDVPLPLAVPFGFFPFTSKYASGIIMPSFGDDLVKGFFLKRGGYYFAFSDYIDLALTGDIYTKGSWGLYLESKYRKRYKFSGNVHISYDNVVNGEKGTKDYSVARNFRISWNHQQDPKANPYITFSASVDFSTSGYNKNRIEYVYDSQQQSKAQTSSSINFSQRFPELPINYSVNVGITQRMSDSTLSLTLPNLTFNLNQIYPFKRKNAVGKERFYEKFTFSMTMSFENRLPSTKENKVFKTSFAKDWENGISYRPNISMPITLFKYLTINPTINYSGRISFKKVEQSWNMAEQRVHKDTISGFFHTFNLSMGISMNTKLYGFYSPLPKIKKALGIGDIRHVLTPSISFTYQPNFGDPLWKFYKQYEKVIVDKTAQEMIRRETVKYSPYDGAPPPGEVQRLSISLANNLEMKVINKAASDTTDVPVYKTISLIDNFTVSGGYNFAADSLKLDDISASLRIKITKSFSLNLSTRFLMYKYGLNENGTPVLINQLRKVPWFTGTQTNFSYTFNNSTFKKKEKKKDKDAEEEEHININGVAYDPEDMTDLNNPYNPKSPIYDETLTGTNADPFAKKDGKKDKKKNESDAEGYQKPDIQWSLSLGVHVGWGRLPMAEFDKKKMDYKRGFYSNGISINGYINPTPNWKLSFNASLQLMKQVKITQLTLNLSRDLHCWHLTASVTPVGYSKSFMVTIGANASMLQDLKYDKYSNTSGLPTW